MKLRYFLFIFSSLSIVNSFSEEFSVEDCYDYVPVNVRLDRALTKDSISRKELINATRIIPEFPLFTIISFTYILVNAKSQRQESRLMPFPNLIREFFKNFVQVVFYFLKK